jgi:hypothetical protein
VSLVEIHIIAISIVLMKTCEMLPDKVCLLEYEVQEMAGKV